MNNSQNPSAVRSKIEITDTLLKLMDLYPYNEITVKQIILESKVARKTFYRNFISKDDVLESYIDVAMHQYISSLKMISSCKLSNILDVITSFCIQNKDLLFKLKNNNLMHMFLHKWNTFIPKIHNQVVSPDNVIFKSFSKEQVEYIIAFNIGAIWNVVMKWIDNDMKEKQDTIKSTLLNYIFNLKLCV